AVASLDPSFEGVTVACSNVTDYGAAVWTVTFPLAAGDVPPLGVDGAGLVGPKVVAQARQLQKSAVPETQRVETSGHGPLSGHFTLQFRGNATAPLPHNASAADMKAALEALPAAGNVTVVRSGPLGERYYPA
ncbi:unnamed protein product, partial [Phaeothamnion confervicola]